MGVDVTDLLGADAGVEERQLHAALGAGAILSWSGDVVGVGGRGRPEHLGVDPGAPRPGVLERLEDERPCPLGHHEAVSRHVEGS